MSRRRLVFAPLADSEILSANEWYEEQGRGVGRKFRAAVRDHIRQIRSHPERNPCYFQNVRRLRILNYPYYIYYRVHDDSIEIITVFHVKRDPDNLSKALEAPSPE